MRTCFALLAITLLLAASHATAQTQPGVVGVGVSLNPTALLVSSEGVEMFLPLWLSIWGALGTGDFNIGIVRA